MKRLAFSGRLPALAFIILTLVISPSLLADGGANHQVPNPLFGVSGGNVNDRTRAFCCSGTLGALVTDGRNDYILSNNHVLARTDLGVVGEDISQPGAIDVGCNVANTTIVGNLSPYPKLGTGNVDAAVAELVAGTMDSSGEIEDIGRISSNPLAPSLGLAVAKSGRTTGYTEGSISAIDANLSVQYQRECGKGKKFLVSYTNQIVITGSSFSAGGDSGSLIVSGHGGASCRRPVGLLYAGSSTTTIANPVGDVLAALKSALNSRGDISFVGTNCTTTAGFTVSDGGPQLEQVEQAIEIKRGHEADLMSRPGVIGVGVGAGDNPAETAIIVFVDSTARATTRLPKKIRGVKVKRIYTEPFVAY